MSQLTVVASHQTLSTKLEVIVERQTKCVLTSLSCLCRVWMKFVYNEFSRHLSSSLFCKTEQQYFRPCRGIFFCLVRKIHARILLTLQFVGLFCSVITLKPKRACEMYLLFNCILNTTQYIDIFEAMSTVLFLSTLLLILAISYKLSLYVSVGTCIWLW